MKATVINNTINAEPDGPALLAQRLVRRLQKDGLLRRRLLEHEAGPAFVSRVNAVTEALADEIHSNRMDRMGDVKA